MVRKMYDAKAVAALESVFRRNLLNTLSGPKPAWVMGTNNPDGTANFGLFSNVVHVGANPPAIGILFRPLTVPRHSFENVFRLGAASFNLVTQDNVGAAHQLSASYPADGTELLESGVQWENDESTGLPVLKDSPVRLILEPEERHEIALNETVFVVFRIRSFEITSMLIGEDGMVDMSNAQAVSCLGLDAYLSVAPLKRFWYAKAGVPLREKPWNG